MTNSEAHVCFPDVRFRQFVLPLFANCGQTNWNACCVALVLATYHHHQHNIMIAYQWTALGCRISPRCAQVLGRDVAGLSRRAAVAVPRVRQHEPRAEARVSPVQDVLRVHDVPELEGHVLPVVAAQLQFAACVEHGRARAVGVAVLRWSRR